MVGQKTGRWFDFTLLFYFLSDMKVHVQDKIDPEKVVKERLSSSSLTNGEIISIFLPHCMNKALDFDSKLPCELFKVRPPKDIEL